MFTFEIAAGSKSELYRDLAAALDSLTADEPDAMYGLVAKSVQISGDGLTYTFKLRPEARFHDGSKLTARDAAY